MRKCVAVLTLILILPAILFSACSKKPPWSFEPLREGSRSFTLKTAHFSCEGTVEVTGCGRCAVSFSQPESLSFVSLCEEQNELTVTVGEHTDTLDLAALPDNAVVKLLLQALQVFLYHKLAYEKGETDTVTAVAEVLGYAVRAVYAENGALRTLRCDEMQLTVTFL